MQLCATDISCAFLQSKCLDKVYIRAGPEFGPELEGRIMRMNKSVYGTKTASAAFHEFLAHELTKLGFQPSKADSDLWMRDCKTHYEYIATWVDDLLIVPHEPMQIITDLEKVFQLKGTGVPEYYLGGDIRRVQKDGKSYLQTDAKTYIARICEKVESLMEWKLRHFMSPEDPEYHLELDESDILEGNDVSKFGMLVSSQNWPVMLGQYDIQHATQTLARYSRIPREGHMKAARRIFGYIKTTQKLPSSMMQVCLISVCIREQSTIGSVATETLRRKCRMVCQNQEGTQLE